MLPSPLLSTFARVLSAYRRLGKIKTFAGTFAVLALTDISTVIAQDEIVNGDLHVVGDLIVDGVAIERQTFFVGGDGDKFYPDWFSDPNWSYGEFDLQVYRPHIHTDSSWKGSLLSRFRSHATSWGHSSEFVESSIRQSSTGRPTDVTQVADYKTSVYNKGITFWLRGQSTYYYHTSDRESVVTFSDSGNGYIQLQEYQGQVVESYVVRDTVSESILANGSSVSDNFKVGGRLGIGTIRAEEIIVEASTWPYYVFEDGYELCSLSEVEAYINEHDRLPGVPSAQEAGTVGVSLGDSQRVLLEKIEELTLYVIHQESAIDRLKKENRRLSALESRLSGLERLLEGKTNE